MNYTVFPEVLKKSPRILEDGLKSKQINWGISEGHLATMNQLRRDMSNNPRIYQGPRRGRKCMSTCIMASHRHNAVYSTEDFHKAMTSACAHGSQVAGCARSSKRISSARGDMRPSDEWMRHVASKTREGNIHRGFARMVVLQLDWLHKIKLPSKGQKIDMAMTCT